VFTSAFWRDLAERVIRTAVQAALALIPATAAGWLLLDWRSALLTIGSAVLACVLMGLAAAPAADRGTASFLPQPRLNRHERAE